MTKQKEWSNHSFFHHNKLSLETNQSKIDTFSKYIVIGEYNENKKMLR